MRCCHQILNVLPKDLIDLEYKCTNKIPIDFITSYLILRFESKIFLLDIIHLAAEVLQGVLQLQHLADQSGFLLDILNILILEYIIKLIFRHAYSDTHVNVTFDHLSHDTRWYDGYLVIVEQNICLPFEFHCYLGPCF